MSKMADSKNGPAAAHERKEGETGTLLPMLIGGLALIMVGMTAVAMFV